MVSLEAGRTPTCAGLFVPTRSTMTNESARSNVFALDASEDPVAMVGLFDGALRLDERLR